MLHFEFGSLLSKNKDSVKHAIPSESLVLYMYLYIYCWGGASIVHIRDMNNEYCLTLSLMVVVILLILPLLTLVVKYARGLYAYSLRILLMFI